MRQIQFGLVALLVLGLASVASAAPVGTRYGAIYQDGNSGPRRRHGHVTPSTVHVQSGRGHES